MFLSAQFTYFSSKIGKKDNVSTKTVAYDILLIKMQLLLKYQLIWRENVALLALYVFFTPPPPHFLFIETTTMLDDWYNFESRHCME